MDTNQQRFFIISKLNMVYDSQTIFNLVQLKPAEAALDYLGWRHWGGSRYYGGWL